MSENKVKIIYTPMWRFNVNEIYQTDGINGHLQFWARKGVFTALKPLIKNISWNDLKSRDVRRLIFLTHKLLELERDLKFTLLKRTYTKEYLRRLFDELIVQMDIGFDTWVLTTDQWCYFNVYSRMLMEKLSNIMAFNRLK